MKFSFGRAVSFALIAGIYAVAAIAGLAAGHRWGEPFWQSILAADVSATATVFLFSLIFQNASVYAPYRSVQSIAILAVSHLRVGGGTAGWVISAAVLLWALRLATNWAINFSGLEQEDWRYSMLRTRCGKCYPLVNFFGIHLLPTLIGYACVLPAVFVLQSGARLCWAALPGLVLSLGGTALESVADRRMRRFRRTGQSGLIRTGPWKYARHPNYLGEILMWWGVAWMAAACLGLRWYLFLGATANTLLFALVTIPMADSRQSRKPGYAAYRQQTRSLLPLPKLRKTGSGL